MTTYSVFLPIVSASPLPPNPKHGLAWNKTGKNNVRPFRFSAYHNWEVENSDLNVQGLKRVQHFSCDFRPYGCIDDCVIDMYGRLEKLGYDYEGTILFLNEPNQPGQCTLSPSAAVRIFQNAKTICPLAKWTLPQVSHVDYLNSWQWTREFLNQLFGVLPFANHYISYGSFHSYIDQIDHMVTCYRALLAEFGLNPPILLTEYGHPDPDTAAKMYHDAMNNPHIKQAFWFTSWVEGGSTNLFDKAGEGAQLTAVGKRLLQEVSK